jgi:hypothetical protein
MRKSYLLVIAMMITCFLGNVQAQAPNCTTNISPANTAQNVNNNPYVTLKWAPVAGATSYDVYLSAKTPPTQLIANVLTDSFNIADLAYATVYYWYVVPRNADGAAVGCNSNTTTFTTIAAPPAPSNDNCIGAITIGPSAINGTTIGATQSMPATVCNSTTGTADDDVWYQFTATAPETIVFTMTGSSSFDGVLEAFTGSCGSLTTLTCSDSTQYGGMEQITINTTAGLTYYFRVYGFYGNLSSRGTFTLSRTASVTPINLLSFKGEHQTKSNVLIWATASEQNNNGFELQYSSDGVHFDKLSFISSKAINGNSSSKLTYQFNDARALSGNAYYRLKQIDVDGKFSYSNIVLLKGARANALSLSNLHPNPARNILNITIDAPANNTVSIEIRDMTGKLLRHQQTTVLSGENSLPVDVAGLASGSYFIKAISSTGDQTSVRKFVKE